MDGIATKAFRTERLVILSTLLVLAVAGWALVGWQATTMERHSGHLDLTMGMPGPLFMAMWVAMMVAMMFPASAPMILAFSRTQKGKRADRRTSVPTAFFVAPYVVVWTVFGLAGYLVARIVGVVAGDSMWAAANLPRVAGALLLVAGAYQLTSLKRVCLRHCRSPLSFMMSYWRDGRTGALSMGLRHGVYCLGCCWALFVVLLPLGVMNVLAMVAVAALVFAEKVMPGGEVAAKVAAAVLIAYGAVVIAFPAALPTGM